MSEVLLGTCGCSYAGWEGIFHPEKQGKLKEYSSILPTTEIDSTFYALPKKEIQGWARHMPPNFTFSPKLLQTITHKKTLDASRGMEEDINEFLETMIPLTDVGKLGCILVQPPSSRRSSRHA